MYNHFFGFRERPFKLVPDPDYLFLSHSHEEALAHLRYAVADGEGFVEIIGEIGTGKTLLCRTFLESLGEDVESAYVFNPRMDALDMLKTVCDEFGIPSSPHESIKSLIDALNAFLIEKKAAGKKTALVIDEAQNLSRDVLEQIRLLSNLETTKDKLIQIFLVGQPELGMMLDAWDLRQLRQRISLRCRLNPLTHAETRRYIAHRIQVASPDSGPPAAVFSRIAARRIYRFSKGIPRLVNMVCDRALLVAYTRNRRTVSGQMAASAIRELSGPQETPRKFPARLLALSAVFFALSLIFLHSNGYFFEKPGILAKKPEARPVKADAEIKQSVAEMAGTGSAPSLVSAPEFQWNKDGGFENIIQGSPAAFSKTASFEKLMSAWGREHLVLPEPDASLDDSEFFSRAARPYGLTLSPVDGDLERIVRLNLPAILKFIPFSGGAPFYMTAIQATPDAMVFSGTPDRPGVAVPYDQVMARWTGQGFVFWKNFYKYQGVVPHSAPGEAVITLKLHLRDIGYPHIGISAEYDLATRMAIMTIQARHGIPVDGLAGPLTQIVLYNETPTLSVPHLWAPLRLPDEIFRKNQAASAEGVKHLSDALETRP